MLLQIESSLFQQIDQIPVGFRSVFQRFASLLQEYAARAPQLRASHELWYFHRIQQAGMDWKNKPFLARFSIFTSSDTAAKQQVIDQVLGEISKVWDQAVQLATAEISERLKDHYVNPPPSSILQALTLKQLNEIYETEMSDSPFSERELEVISLLRELDQITDRDKFELYITRLNYLFSTGHTLRGQGNLAFAQSGGAIGFSVSADFAKLIVPVGLKASVSVSADAELAEAHVVGVQRQNEAPPPSLGDAQPDPKIYAVMDMYGWSGKVQLGAAIELGAGIEVDCGDVTGLELATFKFGPQVKVGASAGGTYIYMSAQDCNPGYYDHVNGMAEQVWSSIVNIGQPVDASGVPGAQVSMWSNVYEAECNAEANIGASIESSVATAEVGLGARAKASGKLGVSGYRYQTQTAPGTARTLSTQDTLLWIKQVEAKASVFAGGQVQVGVLGSELEREKEKELKSFTAVQYESSVALWDASEKVVQVGSGYLVGVSLSRSLLLNLVLKEADSATLQSIASSLQVRVEDFTTFVQSDSLKDLVSSLMLDPNADHGSYFLEASFAPATSGGSVTVDDQLQLDPEFRDTIKTQWCQPQQLQSIRLCFRYKSELDESNRFKLGLSVGFASAKLSFGSISKADFAELVDLYVCWFGPYAGYNAATAKVPENQTMVRPQLIL